MPRIKPFYALKPANALITKVVTKPLESYSVGQAKLIATENPHNFLHLINPELDNSYLRGSRQELVYKVIGDNLEDFIANKILIKEDKPAIYIYRVANNGLVQTGIWTLTHIDDYLEGKIKKHENTVERREKLLAEYLEQTNLDANPVLVTYNPNQIIDGLIEKYVNLNPSLVFTYSDQSQHQIWAVTSAKDLEILISTFNQIPAVYIADGHHRAASMAKMGLHKRSLNKNNLTANYNYFSTAYLSTKQIKVLAYNRLVRDLGNLNPLTFINALVQNFEIEKSAIAVKPQELHQFGMYLANQWYKLVAKPHTYCQNPVDVLDVSILQNFVLSSVLNINDPRTDARLTFEGDKTPLTELQLQVNNGNYAVAFVLYPTSVQQIIDVADANGVMPPKSTWVEPKFLVGLLTHYMG